MDGSFLQKALSKLLSHIENGKREDGHFCFRLECDSTCSSEFILFMHALNIIDEALEKGIANYLRKEQREDGTFGLYPEGPPCLSATIKAYFALKLSGDTIEMPHMQKAKEFILSQGGLLCANVFTKIILAQFQQLPWDTTPFVPIEALLQPTASPLHLNKMSYWARNVTIPLMVVSALQFKAINPKQINVQELLISTIPSSKTSDLFLKKIFFHLDRLGKKVECWIPKKVRKWGIQAAINWLTPRLNGIDGLGGIYPAMEYAYKALFAVGYPQDHPFLKNTFEAMKNLIHIENGTMSVQPCLSPIWDTAIAAHALYETNQKEEAILALDWLQKKQLIDFDGDWKIDAKEVEGGGWAFQYNNPYNPDIDDTAMILWAMAKCDKERYSYSIQRGVHWLLGMQSKTGGFSAFSKDGTNELFNYIPFGDFEALADPPTADVTGRVLAAFGKLNLNETKEAIKKGIDFLKTTQEKDGSWFGRWGTNYIYGTWSVIEGLIASGISHREKTIQKAINFIKKRQNSDGGFGESNSSYSKGNEKAPYKSTIHQTAWALLTLKAAGEEESMEYRKGIFYLLSRQKMDGTFEEIEFNAPGFPNVFYLKYHSYSCLFSLWALSQQNENEEII